MKFTKERLEQILEYGKYQEIDYIFDHREEYDQMVKSSKKLGIRDSATRIYQEVKKIIR